MLRRVHGTLSGRPQNRRGATIVETAIVLPVFFVFIFALFEFGHAMMISNTLKAAARKAARGGTTDGVSSAAVTTKAKNALGNAKLASKVTVRIKDASIFDTANYNATNLKTSLLPDLELKDATTGKLYLVELELKYGDVGVLPMKLLNNLTLKGQAVMRHE